MHGSDFVPAVGPRAEIIRIIESHYYDDGDGRAVNETAAAVDIEELFVNQYGAQLP